MPRKKITWVAVADGGKAMLFVNEGTDFAPALTVLSKAELDNPGAHLQGEDRPGRRPDTGVGQRSAMEATDWHDLGKEEFVRDFAERLNRGARTGRFERLVLAVPPKVLGQLRAALSAEAARCVAAEIGNDLTGLPVAEIERHLARALTG
jgi:protein required for attachment to host cells